MSSRRLKIAIKDHGRKSLSIVNAIRAAGHEFVPDGQADMLLIDFDPPWYAHRELIDKYSGMGAKVVLYPHSGGAPSLSYDALWEPDRRVAANLVTAPGQAEWLRRIDYPAETHAIGWSYCPLRPFRACAEVRNVVFAPIHPNGDGSMVDSYREANTKVFERLLQSPWQVTVRHIGTLEQNGLWKADGVTFVNGRNRPDTAEIDGADAVVAGSGTFPTLAVARGVPTVMYNQGTAALGIAGEQLVPVRRPHLYMDYIRYPFEAADGPLEEIVQAAASSDAPIAHWKRRFIGTPFDARAFIALLERIAAQDETAVAIDPTRRFTTLAFADELLERPELLATYAATFGAGDDATLILWGPALDAQSLLATAEQAIEAAGLDMDGLPDILLLPLAGSPQSDLRLSERADAVLSAWPAVGKIGERPRFGAADGEALRAAAEASWTPALA